LQELKEALSPNERQADEKKRQKVAPGGFFCRSQQESGKRSVQAPLSSLLA
jgi:hypothetical protein